MEYTHRDRKDLEPGQHSDCQRLDKHKGERSVNKRESVKRTHSRFQNMHTEYLSDCKQNFNNL